MKLLTRKFLVATQSQTAEDDLIVSTLNLRVLGPLGHVFLHTEVVNTMCPGGS